ncbi:MAG: class I SAM-dependent rRNA methyltransferase [Bacteroidales bacterium]|nr:class I SAM-dependent rRNA methyltransferase [Bacteroidales bacterium]
MKRPQLIIVPGKEKALQRRHPWIFSGAVKRIEGDPQEGDLVDVVDARGQWMAMGHYQQESIICKVLSFDADEAALPIEEILRRRIHSAVNYRVALGFFGDERTNVFRIAHAEGDYLPGLVADWYNGVLVLQAHSVGMHCLLPVLAELFVHELQTYHGYQLRSVFDKSSATVPGGGVHDGVIWGEDTAENEVLENGIRLTVNFYEGQKTGFFIDQRENRALVQQLAFDRRLLNCFGYTGGFSLAALKGGAEYVETVDISKKAIALCERNVELNFGTDVSHCGVAADVLEYLNTIEKGDYARGYDFIILDPPAFAKNHRSLQAGLKGYRSINQRAMEKIAPGGLLMTFSCSQAVSKDDFQTMVFTAAMNARRSVRIVRQLPHAMDHPVSICHPEGEYLKGLLLQVE